MITKESLQAAQASVNEAAFRIKQLYSNSPSAKTLFFVVEGKDDIPFYATKAEEYVPEGWKLNVIPAGNRNKVIEAYSSLNWDIFSKQRISFFVDRDLSDYTYEDTPNDSNIYVTTKYAIENELCTVDTFIRALKYYCDLIDIDETDELSISSFYNTCWQSFIAISKPIMSQILLQLKAQYANAIDVLPDLFSQSRVSYSAISIESYTELLDAKHTPDEYIRGKFVLTFFSKTLTYVARNSASVLPSHKKAKDSLGLGYENVIVKLCGIMKVPDSLRAFFLQMKDQLIMINS